MTTIRSVALAVVLALFLGCSQGQPEPQAELEIEGEPTGSQFVDPKPAPTPKTPDPPAPRPRRVEKSPPPDKSGGASGNVDGVTPPTPAPPPAPPAPPPAATASNQPPDPVVAPSPPPPPGEAPNDPAPATVVLEADAPIEIRLAERIGSASNGPGDRFQANLDRPLELEGGVTIPHGSLVIGEVLESQASGKVKGRARFAIKLTQIEVEGTRHVIETNKVAFEAEGTEKEDAKKVGIAAGIGAIIGGIFGGKGGAAKGAVIGGGAGGAGVLLTKGEEVELEREQKISFRLEEDLQLQVR